MEMYFKYQRRVQAADSKIEREREVSFPFFTFFICVVATLCYND